MPPAANNAPGGAAAADRGLLTVHDATPRDDATHQPSSSSSLASLPVRRESDPIWKGIHEVTGILHSQSLATPFNSRLPSTTSKRYATPPLLWQDVGHDRTCGILSCSRRDWETRRNLRLAWCSPS